MGLAFLIVGDKLQLLSERKVLKEYEYSALLDAAGVVEAARGEASDIVHAAEAQAEQSRQQGFEQGWEAAQRLYSEQAVSAALQAQSQLRALREAMARLVVKALGQILVELPADGLLEAALERVDDLLRHESFITLRVASGQEVYAQQALDRLSQRANWASIATVQVDPELHQGDCVVQTASGSLEIGLDAQLAAMERALQLDGAAGPLGAPH